MNAVIIKNGLRPICCVGIREEKVIYLRNYIYEKEYVGDYRVSHRWRTGMRALACAYVGRGCYGGTGGLPPR